MLDQALASKPKILVADDNEELIVPFQLLLEYDGYEVHTARRGSEVLRLTSVHKYDAAILDIGLPDMDGYELARRLRAYPNNAQLFMIALTGWQAPGLGGVAEAAGFDRLLLKPVDFDMLEELIRVGIRSGSALTACNRN